MPKLVNASEKEEIIDGIKRGFADVQFIGRFLDVFIQSIRLKAQSPGKDLFTRIIDNLNASSKDKLIEKLGDSSFQKKIIHGWEIDLKKNKLKGHTISSLTSVCVEAYLQNGRYFTKGDGTNDLKRISDGSRWEIKGNRGKDFKLTINQSHVGLDDTRFILYCGYPEENQLHGIYCIKGDDKAFSPIRKGLNMRNFLNEYFNKLVEKIYPD